MQSKEPARPATVQRAPRAFALPEKLKPVLADPVAWIACGLGLLPLVGYALLPLNFETATRLIRLWHTLWPIEFVLIFWLANRHLPQPVRSTGRSMGRFLVTTLAAFGIFLLLSALVPILKPGPFGLAIPVAIIAFFYWRHRGEVSRGG